MSAKNFAAIPVVLAFAACSSGGNSGATIATSTPEPLSLSMPQATGEPTQYETLAAALEALPGANEGDSVTVPLTELDPTAPADANVTVTVGETKDGVTLLRSDIPAFDGNAGSSDIQAVSSLQDFANSVGTEPTNPTFRPLTSETVNGTLVRIGATTADNDYGQLFSDAGTTEAEFATQTLDGSTYNEVAATRNSASFNKTSGSFGYSGKAALAVADEVALGDVTMSADFDAGTASITAPSLTVDASETTAGFNGSVAIDNASGHYASSSATITVNEQNYDAGIIGTFSSDAATSSGAVFGADQNTAAGVFSVVQDAE